MLAVEPRAGTDAIQDAYAKLAKKAKEDGDSDKLEALNQAYEVLIDPVLRREFDKLKGIGEEKGPPKFSGIAFFESLDRDVQLRQALLCILYDRRRTRPFTPSVSVRNLEAMLAATSEEIVLALWYLKARNLAANDDKSSVLITVDGIDMLEKNRPDPAGVMRFVKPAVMAGYVEEPAAAPVVLDLAEPELVAVAAESVALPGSSLSILRRVLSKA